MVVVVVLVVLVFVLSSLPSSSSSSSSSLLPLFQHSFGPHFCRPPEMVKFPVFLHIFDIFEAKHIVNTDDFGGLEAQNHDTYSVFWLLVAKTVVFTLRFAHAEQKDWYLRSFERVARCRFYRWKIKRDVFYDIFASRPQTKESKNYSKKMQKFSGGAGVD